MIHRHLAYPEGTPPEALGDAAIDDLLDRGDLADWRPLLKAIAADPHGPLADRVLRLCELHPRYGTSPLWREWIAHERAQFGPPRPPAVSLAGLRRQLGVSQSQLAHRIGMSQSDLSKLERRTDLRMQTLTRVLAGLGIHARVLLEDDKGQPVATLELPASDGR